MERALVDGANAMAGGSRALSLAAQRGHEECVRLLIPVSDPLQRNSLALRWAASHGHVECVGLLLPVSEQLPQAADGARKEGFVDLAGLIEAFIESQALSGRVQTAKINPRAKSAL